MTQWRCGSFRFDTRFPVLMGVLNVTPDSFSDGGHFLKCEDALSHAQELLEAGAQIIDVGGESTRPGATSVSVEEELSRVLPVVEALAQDGICVSVDTRHASVARSAVSAGAAIINDVSGFRDPAMREVAAENNCGLVVMHMQGEPHTMQQAPIESGVVEIVCDYLSARAATLREAGIARERICLDPGPGFGKTPQQSLELMRNIASVCRLGYPVMAAPSRKSYVGFAYGIDEPLQRDEASATEALLACEQGASVLRMHNIGATVQALKNLRPYVFVAMGSNVALTGEDGETREGKIAVLNQAIMQMCTLPDTYIVDISSFYESEPAYFEAQERFVNAVLLMRTGLAPRDLLKYLQAIENSLGRVRTLRNGPRTCDLDIIDYQCYVSDDCELSLPHPRLLERDFVLEPLREIRPYHVLANELRIPQDAVPCDKRIGRAFRI